MICRKASKECAWRMLPNEFPPWETVCTDFRNWSREGTWDNIQDTLHHSLRLLSRRNA